MPRWHPDAEITSAPYVGVASKLILGNDRQKRVWHYDVYLPHRPEADAAAKRTRPVTAM